jgi:hypothetical protein
VYHETSMICPNPILLWRCSLTRLTKTLTIDRPTLRVRNHSVAHGLNLILLFLFIPPSVVISTLWFVWDFVFEGPAHFALQAHHQLHFLLFSQTPLVIHNHSEPHLCLPDSQPLVSLYIHFSSFSTRLFFLH